VTDVETRNEGIFLAADPKCGETYREILTRLGQDSIEVTGSFAFPYKMLKYSMNAYAVHFCDVRVDENTRRDQGVRAGQGRSTKDALSIQNERSQIVACHIIMGIGMALD